jgi:hypothetical protein
VHVHDGASSVSSTGFGSAAAEGVFVDDLRPVRDQIAVVDWIAELKRLEPLLR